VLTWWYGMGGPAGGDIGKGMCMLAALDRTPVATIGTFVPDAHELRLTPANTALITSYLAVPCDLSAVGGLANGQVQNSYCEEVDVASGRVLHRWSALDHVPLTDSYYPRPPQPTFPTTTSTSTRSALPPNNHLLISA
jgi:hypothetical protein